MHFLPEVTAMTNANSTAESLDDIFLNGACLNIQLEPATSGETSP
jgi:hypothetical protein